MKATDEALARQSLARVLTPLELELAVALESVFASGEHSTAQVAAQLQKRGIRRPSGAQAAWTAETLEEELRTINSSLDAAYTGQPAGRSA
ncbi:MAG: recombinase-like helix-turn-helix domain-containing protein [Steroidobacteraceae bacterium]